MKEIMKELSEMIDRHIAFRKFNIRTMTSESHYFAIKLLDWKLHRYTVFDIVNIVPHAKTFMIRGRNSFESYSNCNLPR